MKKYFVESGFASAFITIAVAVFCGLFVECFFVADVPTGLTPLQTVVFVLFAFAGIGYLVWWCWELCDEYYYFENGGK